MKIIHLQNLPSKATSENVRDFFEGFHVVEGGVHITTSYDGSVFVSFMSDEDAVAAVQLDGRRIFGEPVKLSLCTEQEKEDRLKKLEEEDQILTDCQEIEDHTSSHGDRPDRFGPNYTEPKIRSSIFSGQLQETEAGHLRSALHDNYIQVRNINQQTEVADLMRFFKGIRAAVRRDSIVVLDAADGTERNVAFLRIENRRAFEIALKMDESLVDGYPVQIMECTKEDFESARGHEDDFREFRRERAREIMHRDAQPRSVSPVREEQVLRGYGFQEDPVESHEVSQHPCEYHLYVKMLPTHATKGDVMKLFQKCDPGYISLRPDRHKQGWNEALVVLPDKEMLRRAMEKDNIWYEGVQIEVRLYSKRPKRSVGRPPKRLQRQEQEQEATHYPILFLADLSDGISPRDVRFLFGVLSRSIPRDGIIIRPDVRGDHGYVAFVKFNAQRDFLQAKDMWMNHKGGLHLKGKKIYQSLCTPGLIRNYKLDSLWDLPKQPKTEDQRYSGEVSRRGESPIYLRSISRSRSRSPIRSRHSEYDTRRRNPRKREQADFGEAARAVAEREQEMSWRDRAMTQNHEPDFGEASRRNHNEEVKHNRIFLSGSSSSTMHFDGFRSQSPPRFRSQSPPRFRRRSRSLSLVSSLPIDESWSPSMDSSVSPSHRSPRSRSRSPVQHQHHGPSPNQTHSLSRSYSPMRSGGAPFTFSVPQEQNPDRNTDPPPPQRVLQPDLAVVATPETPRFIRVSPMPAWANDIWLTQFFSDCAIKKTSVLIKYNAGKPVHAYLECMTNADVEKACLRNGTYVGTDRICVEPLGDMMK